MDLNETIKSFQTLTKEELKYLKAHIEFLIAYSDKDVTIEMELYDALHRALHEVTQAPLVAFHIFKRHHEYKQFAEQTEKLSTYTSNILPKITKVQRVKIFSVYAMLIRTYMRNHNYPASMASMVSLLERIPELIEEQFPGYIASGVQSIIINAKGE